LFFWRFVGGAKALLELWLFHFCPPPGEGCAPWSSLAGTSFLFGGVGPGFFFFF